MNRENKTLLKLILLGNTGVGKTSLMRYYTCGRFTESYKATIGADFITKQILLENENETILQIWDTAGQERYSSLSQAFYRGSDICVLVYNVTDPHSFDSLDKWYDDFVNQANILRPPSNPPSSESIVSDESGSSEIPQFPFVVVGNMVDRESRVPDQKVYEWMYKKNIPTSCFFKTSAKDGISVEQMFGKAAEEGYKRFTEYKQEIFIPPILDLHEENESCCELFRNFFLS